MVVVAAAARIVCPAAQKHFSGSRQSSAQSVAVCMWSTRRCHALEPPAARRENDFSDIVRTNRTTTPPPCRSPHAMGETLSTLTGGSNGGGSDAAGGSADAGSTRATQEAPAAAASSSASHASHASGVALTRAEVSRHATTDDAWVVIDSNVYNITPLLDDHPGGPEVLLEQIGAFPAAVTTSMSAAC